MPDPTFARPTLSVLQPPYHSIERVKPSDPLPLSGEPPRGAALIWELAGGDWGAAFRRIRDRPGGVALIMILPPADELVDVSRLLEATARCQPHSILPFQSQPRVEEMRSILRKAPAELPVSVMDYLAWRGVQAELDVRRLVRKTVELSAELRTVQGLARSLYMSRRALGRRFRKAGLPVPSHVLHFSRILRAAIKLQTTDRTLFEVACDFRYPDGFSLSNQMVRLTGVRPSAARTCLGWEWIVEAWLRAEASEGRLAAKLGDSPRVVSANGRKEGPDPVPEQVPERTSLPRAVPRWRRPTRSPNASA